MSNFEPQGLAIGGVHVPGRVLAAPMTGVTDLPFRERAYAQGAGLVVSEMVASGELAKGRGDTVRRIRRAGNVTHVVQLAGREAAAMVEAARIAEGEGADIVDINMGCPAKKVTGGYCGSALMRDEPLALEIVSAVVDAVAPHGVPVTLKMRTGWSADHRNAVKLARDFESAGVQMLTVHGRTREHGYKGDAEYDTIAAVKAAVRVPVVANGDITTPEKARDVLAATGADAVMIGRAAQGRPWIFREIAHFLATGTHLAPPLVAEVRRLLLDHLREHYALYGDYSGVRTARKHIGWAVRELPGGEAFRAHMNLLDDCETQWHAVADWFESLAERHAPLPRLAANDERLRRVA